MIVQVNCECGDEQRVWRRTVSVEGNCECGGEL